MIGPSKKTIYVRNTGRQAGIGLLGLMLALAVIALLLLMATRYYAITHRSQELNSATSDVSFLLAGIQTFRSSRDVHAGLTFGDLFKEGLLPDSFNQANASMGKTMEAGPVWAGCTSKIDLATTEQGVDITFSKLNPEICKGLTQRLMTKKDKASWIKIDDHTAACGDKACSAVFKVLIVK